ncbi:hypothetical protein GPECTOR_68g343 [Gonium pectorale]|uniref:Sugar phosphate transporter domain-containing protein n=1 Tax=Gonium pectorale TaxID=33097 RepID=A0A150G3C0_GONPE|nr:hypothetical protein GPECTOR_68g343 [Gonium pectorale]|eukprot:KXZ44372.1 hypothetical protein GPECTOR_68g343 [Gonium pectorale]
MTPDAAAARRKLYVDAAITYGYIVLWIGLSAGVILINKYILGYGGFPFPVALTMVHMALCSSLAFLLIKAGVVPTIQMENEMYYKNVVPIAALFAGTLWLGNAAYVYLSVSFIQMIKATMPAAVFSVGILLGTEKYSHKYALTLAVVTVGVATASYGEIAFNLIGFLFQSGSIVTESFRLCLIQLLLQARGIKLNPVTTLYYIAPPCFLFLCPPFLVLEAPRMLNTADVEVPYNWLLLSSVVAFALNMSVFLLIGRSSALTMNLAGVIKDWMLIGLSVLLYGSSVTPIQLGGYLVAFGGVTFYNYLKMQQASQALAAQQQQQQAQAQASGDEEKQALLSGAEQNANSSGDK